MSARGGGGLAGCAVKGDFAAQVGKIRLWDCLGEQFFDQWQEVM
jgi:hypothetical protein